MTCLPHSTPAALNTQAAAALHVPCIGCYCMPPALHATAPTVLHIIALTVLRFIAPPALHARTLLCCPMHTYRWSAYPCAGCAQHTHRGHASIAHLHRDHPSIAHTHTHTHRGHLAHMQPSPNGPTVHAVQTQGSPYTVQRHHPIRCTSGRLPLHGCCCRSPPQRAAAP